MAAPTIVLLEDLDPAIFPGLIRHLPEFQVLYCLGCKSVCFPARLEVHLCKFHKALPAAGRKLVAQYCRSLDVAKASTNTRPTSNYTLPLNLLPILPGYSCIHCLFLTTNRTTMRKHVNKAHQLFRHACSIAYTTAQLQTWFTDTRAQYWCYGHGTQGMGEGSREWKYS